MGRVIILCLALVVVASSAMPVAQRAANPARPPAEARRLDAGATIERELSKGQSHRYTLTLHAGDFVHVTIFQRGIDIVATFTGPDGRMPLSVDACDDLFRPETVTAIVDADGPYTIAIAPVQATTAHGRYAIRLEVARLATPDDSVRVEAARAFERGRTLEAGLRQADLAEALATINSALDRYRQLSDRRGEMNALLEVTRIKYRSNRAKEALEPVRQVERLARELGDDATAAVGIRAEGLVNEWLGDIPAALRLFEQSAALARAIGDPKAETDALNDMGVVYGRTGDTEAAIASFEQALPRARAAGNLRAVYFMLNNLGIAYRDVGEYEKALRVLREALADRQIAGDLEGQVTVLNNLGNLLHTLKQDRQALATHLQALAIARRSGGKENLARSLNTAGQSYSDLGDYSKALESVREGLVIRREIGDLAGQSASLEAEGRVLHQLGDHSTAEVRLRESVAIRRSIRDQRGELTTLRVLAEVERDEGRRAEAIADIRSALDIEERLRQRITSPDLRASFRALEHDKYAFLVDLLQEPAASRTAGDVVAAFEVSERARARVLLESLLHGRVDLREGITPDLLERERALQKQLNEASARLTRALVSRKDSPQATAAAQAVDDLASQYQTLEMEIRQTSPRYAAVMQPSPLTSTEIQQTVLDDDTVLLEFMLGEQRSWMWAVTPQSIDVFALPPQQKIESAARSLSDLYTARQRRARGDVDRQRVASADTRLRVESAATSRMLFGPIADRLGGDWRSKRLAIVAGGALEYLPFAALPAPTGHAVAGRTPSSATPRLVPLVEQHEIVTLPSASVLSVLRREASQRTAPARTLAILADPVFDSSDPRVKPAPVVRTSAGSLRPDRRLRLSRLPFSREEADTIASFVRRDEVFEATGFKATRALALGDTLGGYRIVHFATHGVVDDARPALSGLVLSLVDERGTPSDGYVRLHDIYNLRLHADLVVLSACQTALGKQIRGEGLVGLARAFMYAGAPRVVASLWEVDDVATAELMKCFYRALLRDRLRPAAALRSAQREMAANPRWAPPYYWAGFVLEGDWR